MLPVTTCHSQLLPAASSPPPATTERTTKLAMGKFLYSWFSKEQLPDSQDFYQIWSSAVSGFCFLFSIELLHSLSAVVPSLPFWPWAGLDEGRCWAWAQPPSLEVQEEGHCFIPSTHPAEQSNPVFPSDLTSLCLGPRFAQQTLGQEREESVQKCGKEPQKWMADCARGENAVRK